MSSTTGSLSLDVLHIPRSSFAYAINHEAIHIRLQTRVELAKQVDIVYGDGFLWDERRSIPMIHTTRSLQHDWFEVEISLPKNRYSYYFVIHTREGSFQYGEEGLSNKIDPGTHGEKCFHFRYLSESEIFLPPAWVQDSLFYLAFPDRFRSPKKSWTSKRLSASEAELDTSWKGGTLRGIIDSIPYLKNLGVSALYLTPIFRAQSYHRYDTIDYFAIDPMLGNKDDFSDLVSALHSEGIRILLDGVFNHCGSEFPFFKDLVEKGRNSAYKNWFYATKFPIDLEGKTKLLEEIGWENWLRHKDGAEKLEYETFAFTPYMPRLRTSNPEVQDYFIEVARYWMRNFDVDGWRLDVADEVSPEFWRRFRSVVKSENPEAYIIGEVWYDARFWLDGTQFDAVMNYPILSVCEDFFAKKSIDSQEMRFRLNEALMRYSWPVNLSLMNLFESHDTTRFLSTSEGDIASLLLAYCFVLTFPGAPLIYYGSEIGMEGRMPHGNRLPMNWDSSSWNSEVLKTVRELSDIRQKYPALRRGSFAWLEIDNPLPNDVQPNNGRQAPLYEDSIYRDIIAFERKFKNERVLVFINRGNRSAYIPTSSLRTFAEIANGSANTRIPEKSLSDLVTREQIEQIVVPAGSWCFVEAECR